MDYKIKCTNCGHEYRLTAEGGQTIWARCPNCGQKMRVNLPIVNSNSQPQTVSPVHPISNGNNNQNNSINVNDGKKNGGNHTTNILLALILGIIVGGLVWFVWQQKQKNDTQAQIELKEARKAHMDSLMALRNQQNAEEAAAQQAEEDQNEVKSFLNDFYQQWFAGGDMSNYANNLSQQCYERLSDMELEENPDEVESDSTSNSIDWQIICPTMKASRRGHGNPASLRIDISHEDGNWYRIRFMSGNNTEYRQLEAFPQNGKVIINDFR